MKIPTKDQVPETGFHYHYKHDPAKGVRDYAYEVCAVGFHTEDDCRTEDTWSASSAWTIVLLACGWKR
jgi:hypothetical protein